MRAPISPLTSSRRSSSGLRLRWAKRSVSRRASTQRSTNGDRSATAGRTRSRRIQMDERARTGINSLKVGYNRVFGYFIEVTNSNAHLVPADYQRRQTLTGAERYVTPALKEHEEKVLTAAERIEQRERELFEALRRRAGAQIRDFSAQRR